MRLFAAEEIPLDVILALQELRHDVLWQRMDRPGARDAETLERAARERRLLLTFDAALGERARRTGTRRSPGTIVLLLPLPSSAAAAKSVVAVLRSRDDWAGHHAIIRPPVIRLLRAR